MTPELTVGDLVDRLSASDRDAVVRLRINPFARTVRRLGGVVPIRDEAGRPAVYLAEATDAAPPGPLPEKTAGDLLDQLAACDRGAAVRFAINPDFPMAHRAGPVTSARDEEGRPVLFLTEPDEDEAEQFGPLPPDVAVALTWHEPTEAPLRRRRRARPGGH
ncbi:hypothetical protein [Streptomyces sp. MNP-20]|uniref:hypothetical protein n=1 Tax=Streptomyces sp. MNP-20 TaxID=2721165 RepID=UPI002816310D|nr:hypothetical protein [Streptomyces sp. MNP-20]